MSELKPRRVNIRLKPGRDDAILRWLAAGGKGNAGAMIRIALNLYLSGEQASELPPPPPSSPDPPSPKKESKDRKQNREESSKKHAGSSDDPEGKVDDLLANFV